MTTEKAEKPEKDWFPLSSRIGFLHDDIERINGKKMTKAEMKANFLRLLKELHPMVKALESAPSNPDSEEAIRKIEARIQEESLLHMPMILLATFGIDLDPTSLSYGHVAGLQEALKILRREIRMTSSKQELEK